MCDRLYCVYLVEPINNGTLRLVGSHLPREGRLEMYISDQWVRVCDDGWDKNEADVVCKQLGFGTTGRVQQFQISGDEEEIKFQSSGDEEQIKIPNFSCFGNESTLLNCSHREMGMADCDNSDDVGIICTGTTPGGYLSSYICTY